MWVRFGVLGPADESAAVRNPPPILACPCVGASHKYERRLVMRLGDSAACASPVPTAKFDFEEYLRLQSHTFVQYYRCLPISLLNKGQVDEDGNRVIMPQSALDRLDGLTIQYPMLFQIQNPGTERVTHCGVLEFTADEGFIHMPVCLMAQLGVRETEIVLVRSTTLPTATFVKLQPHTTDFHSVACPKDLLEHNFMKFPCVTAGETIAVMEGERRFYLDVVEARPADAVCTLDTDCEVEFATALDYVEPPPPPVASKGNDEKQPARFTGAAARMDGKTVEQQPPAPPVPVVGGHGDQPRKPVQFTGTAARVDGKPVEEPPETVAAVAGAPGATKRKFRYGAPSAAGNGASKSKEEGGATAKDKEQQKPFTGTQYSLKD
ncbi:hypothetical protein U9M48_020729 [Paspalum notatum var. saurae]|uniref:Ubiquitin fusion degradation protein n=1 Tax=Paspalum notatum var. saurae TaxID=547442 RepID=A0AAQ3WSR3_PASNO